MRSVASPSLYSPRRMSSNRRRFSSMLRSRQGEGRPLSRDSSISALLCRVEIDQAGGAEQCGFCERVIKSLVVAGGCHATSQSQPCSTEFLRRYTGRARQHGVNRFSSTLRSRQGEGRPLSRDSSISALLCNRQTSTDCVQQQHKI
jgi:hypothetical protein